MGDMRTTSMDMTRGPLATRIVAYALPIAATDILHQLFNATDIAVVGRYSGKAAMAAVGANSSMINLLVCLFDGLSIGVTVVLAQAIGRGDKDGIHKGVHTAITLGFISGLLLALLGITLSRPLLVLMKAPDDVLDLAAVYLRIYFAGMPVLMLYNFTAAILRAAGDTKRPLFCLTAGGVLNVFLNLLFVIAFHLDVVGVAVATVISNTVSMVMVLHILTHEKGELRFSWKQLCLNPSLFKQMLHIGLPAGLQSMLFSISNVVIQSSINSFGSACVAGNSIGLTYEGMTNFVNNSFTNASMTFTGQNYGARKPDRCRKVYRWSLLIATGSVLVLCLLSSHYAEPMIRLFTSDETVIPYGIARIHYAQRFHFLASFYCVASGCLRGIGYSIVPSVMTIFGVCVFRLIWIATVFRAWPVYPVLAAVYPVTWGLTAIMVTSAYFVLSRKVYRRLEHEAAQH